MKNAEKSGMSGTTTNKAKRLTQLRKGIEQAEWEEHKELKTVGAQVCRLPCQ